MIKVHLDPIVVECLTIPFIYKYDIINRVFPHKIISRSTLFITIKPVLIANTSFYAPNFGKVEGAYCFGLVHPSEKLKDRVLKFQILIHHQKITDTYFF